MKKYCAWSVSTWLWVSGAIAAQPAQLEVPDPVSAVVDRGQNHRVIETTSWHVLSDGSITESKSQQVELATGMHYRNGDTWVESRELIEPDPNGAVAHYGPHKAAFAANLNTRGAIQVIDEAGNRFTSHILGVAFTDAGSGQSVLIAPIKDSVGQIVPPNQIVYSDAFDGIKCDVRYTYRRDGFEQDLILREALPVTPGDYQMNPETTKIEIFTEFIESPAGASTEQTLRAETDPVKRLTMASPDFVDQTLQFGPMQIGKGRAIDFQGVVTDEIAVGKTWQVLDGRTFLVESVEFGSIQPALNALPQKQAKAANGTRTAQAKLSTKGANTVALRAIDRAALGSSASRARIRTAIHRPFPRSPKQQAAVDRKPMRQLAGLNLRPGVLVDYVQTMTSGLTNFIFRPEATHTVAGTINLYGTSTLVGGTVVKYSKGGELVFSGPIVCDTTPYHPAVFTAIEDNTIGDSTATKGLSGYYALNAIRSGASVTGELHDLRFSYAATAIDWSGSQDRFYNLQFINCSNALRRVNSTNAPVHNVLMTNVVYAFLGSNTLFNAQHVTLHNIYALENAVGSPATLTLTNSILLNVTNLGTGSAVCDYLATNGTPSLLGSPAHAWVVTLSDFQVAVGGYHYLATNSSLHDVGTTNIATNILAEITALTTYAPTLLTSTAQVDVTLSPIVPRDSDTPDLGYHYAPLDYILRGYTLNTNVVLAMTNGVAIAMDYNGSSYGLIFNNATNLCLGSPTNMNRIVLAWCVQERSLGNSTQIYYMFNDSGTSTHGPSEARFRFTEFAAMARHGGLLYVGRYWTNWECSHSWLYNLSIGFGATNGTQTIGFTNNVVEWGDATLQRSPGSSAYHLRNNLFRRHALTVSDLNSSSTIRDNLFDSGTITTNTTTVSHSYNAFYQMTNNGSFYATNALPGQDHNLPLTSLTYHTDPYGRYGPYGRYYQPTNSLLINAGSQNATNAGLYHFTCTTNQVKETNSVVDIGPHYVALNASGNPQDYDSDGIPDYFEDWNGNGSVDSGETDSQSSGDPGLIETRIIR